MIAPNAQRDRPIRFTFICKGKTYQVEYQSSYNCHFTIDGEVVILHLPKLVALIQNRSGAIPEVVENLRPWQVVTFAFMIKMFCNKSATLAAKEEAGESAETEEAEEEAGEEAGEAEEEAGEAEEDAEDSAEEEKSVIMNAIVSLAPQLARQVECRAVLRRSNDAWVVDYYPHIDRIDQRYVLCSPQYIGHEAALWRRQIEESLKEKLDKLSEVADRIQSAAEEDN